MPKDLDQTFGDIPNKDFHACMIEEIKVLYQVFLGKGLVQKVT